MSYEGGIWRREQPKSEYRWRCGTRTGRWRPTHDLAGDAAVSAGLATWEPFGRSRRLHLGPLVEIEARRAPAAGTKKGAGSLRRPSSPPR